MPTKIFVGCLPEGSKTEEVRALFEAHGKVAECDVVKDYAFVHMESESEARAAIEALNGYEFKGIAITVEESRSKIRTKPGMGGKTQCFRCGKSGHWSKECRLGGGGYGAMRGMSGRQSMRPYGRPTPYDRRPPPPPHHPSPYDPYYERHPTPYDRYDYRDADYYARRSPPPPRPDYYSNGYANYERAPAPSYREQYDSRYARYPPQPHHPPHSVPPRAPYY